MAHRSVLFSILGASIFSVIVAGCASVPLSTHQDGSTTTQTVATNSVPTAPVAAIYADLTRAMTAYQFGNKAPGHDAMLTIQQQALLQIKSDTKRCAALAGCNMLRFTSAYEQLLATPRYVDSTTVQNPPEIAQSTEGEESPVLWVLPQTERSVILLSHGILPQLIASNAAIRAAIEEWLTSMRPQLMNTWVNYQYLRTQMEPAYKKTGLPEALLFGIMAKESAGKVHAVSRSGAAGPLQFMPATAARFGLRVVNGFDQRFDPKLEAQANAAFIDEQLKTFNNNLALTLAAYNSGEGFVSRLVRGQNNASLWEPRIFDALSAQTREYVPMVLAAAWLFLHSQQYNLEFPKIDGAPGLITLNSPASLSELAICLGQAGRMRDGWFRTLRNLNPRLKPQKTQPAGTRIAMPSILESVYAKQCRPGGNWLGLARVLHAAAPPVFRPLHIYYQVRQGDTLYGIARHFRCAQAHGIARINGLRPPHYIIHPGMRLRIPTCQRS